jgi:hypothetical protein
MKTISIVFFCIFISSFAFSQEEKADYNEDYWSFSTKDATDFNNLEDQNGTTYFKTSIIHYPIENDISGKGKYTNDKKDSIWIGFYKDGKPFFTEWYNKGKLKKGISFDVSGKQYFYTKEVLNAHPKNGWDDFVMYAQNYWNKVSDYIERKYPENFKLLKGNEIEVSFVILISENGKVDIGKIANGLNYGFDKLAAKKMLSNYKNKWIAALHKGQLCNSKFIYTVKIKF